MRIVASTASMLEEPITKNEEPFWAQPHTFKSHCFFKAPRGSAIDKLLLLRLPALLRLLQPHKHFLKVTKTNLRLLF